MGVMIMKISEVQPGQGKIDVEGLVSEKGEIREFQKFGKVGRVCNAKLQDDSGSISLTLWNEQIDQIQQGAKVRVTNGYAREWQGESQLSTGKFGKLEVLEGGEAPKEEKPSVPEQVDEEVVE